VKSVFFTLAGGGAAGPRRWPDRRTSSGGTKMFFHRDRALPGHQGRRRAVRPVLSRELGPRNVTVNALSPGSRTRTCCRTATVRWPPGCRRSAGWAAGGRRRRRGVPGQRRGALVTGQNIAAGRRGVLTEQRRRAYEALNNACSAARRPVGASRRCRRGRYNSGIDPSSALRDTNWITARDERRHSGPPRWLVSFAWRSPCWLVGRGRICG